MRSGRGARCQQGFTLIEVLVAIALMALVSVIAWRGLQHIAQARAGIAAQAADTDQVIRALGQLARDVELAYAGPAFETAASDAVTLTPGIRLSARQLSRPVLDLVRPDPEGAGLWHRVQWRVDARGLWRATGAAAPRMPLPLPDQAVLILPGATALTLRAWLTNTGWVATTATPGSTPQGLELTVERGPQQRYARVVELP
ncbi:prepilin-type N-terminal cleavage/methylation domain-containing protein [Bordetella genomosp. 12]|uniref:General secretion pathway protein GspJ n=1 Tax=Bordetella genomosp. 12 TaxID=463035 RepID=A0A261VE85_9BORD|nr:prepilin-type N-terminal cleavage/methylation domain-containing protein [Bordetella genomosp. 12]OZI71890.1 general secretion pathway protein GspJ [Bordetella genomosp. 12]